MATLPDPSALRYLVRKKTLLPALGFACLLIVARYWPSESFVMLFLFGQRVGDGLMALGGNRKDDSDNKPTSS